MAWELGPPKCGETRCGRAPGRRGKEKAAFRNDSTGHSSRLPCRPSLRDALFQTAALLTWDPAALLALLHLDAGERAQGLADLERVAVGVGTQRGEALVAALLAALPAI